MADTQAQLQNAAAKIGIGSYQRHVFLCTGPSCCTPQMGLEAWEALKKALKEHNLGGVCQRSKVGCLRICCHGPTLVVYPEGTWYHDMTAERIPRFVREHLIEGRPIGEWIFARNPLPNENAGGSAECSGTAPSGQLEEAIQTAPPSKLGKAVPAAPHKLEEGIQTSPNPLPLWDRERKREDGPLPISEQLRPLVWFTMWAMWGALASFLIDRGSSEREMILSGIVGGIIGAIGGWIGSRFVGKRTGQSLILFWTFYWAIGALLSA